MAVVFDLPELPRGDYRRFKVTITDGDNQPVNIVGDLVTFTMKANANADDPGDLQVKVTVPNDTDGQNGIAFIDLEKSLTETLTPGVDYSYDIQWVDIDAVPESRPYTLMTGIQPVIRDITQSTAP